MLMKLLLFSDVEISKDIRKLDLNDENSAEENDYSDDSDVGFSDDCYEYENGKLECGNVLKGLLAKWSTRRLRE